MTGLSGSSTLRPSAPPTTAAPLGKEKKIEGKKGLPIWGRRREIEGKKRLPIWGRRRERAGNACISVDYYGCVAIAFIAFPWQLIGSDECRSIEWLTVGRILVKESHVVLRMGEVPSQQDIFPNLPILIGASIYGSKSPVYSNL